MIGPVGAAAFNRRRNKPCILMHGLTSFGTERTRSSKVGVKSIAGPARGETGELWLSSRSARPLAGLALALLVIALVVIGSLPITAALNDKMATPADLMNLQM